MFSLGEPSLTDMFKSGLLNEQGPLVLLVVVVFPGVGEVHRQVNDDLTLAVGSSKHANVDVTFKDYSNGGTVHVAASSH